MTQLRTIIITGASSGIGAALTRALAGDGHRLFVCARREERLAEVTENGRLATYRALDVTDVPQMTDFAKLVASEAGTVDTLICCAGAYGSIGPIHEADPEEWWETVRGNLFGTFLAANRFVPLMRGSADARLITFSGGGFGALPRYSAYASAKAGVVRLTETMAAELKPLGIAVNAIAPGFVKTEIHDATLKAGPEIAGAKFYAFTKEKLESGSVPIETEIDCVRFLLSPAAQGLTGKTISPSVDPWRTPIFREFVNDISRSDLYTMRRINLTDLEDEDMATALTRATRES
jgi:NAD(P)-dependent dehydrogenase (short-subunit alcohol dehydrogenase family)